MIEIDFLFVIKIFPVRDFWQIWQLPNCKIVIFVDSCGNVN